MLGFQRKLVPGLNADEENENDGPDDQRPRSPTQLQQN